jgi:hypothetical protein
MNGQELQDFGDWMNPPAPIPQQQPIPHQQFEMTPGAAFGLFCQAFVQALPTALGKAAAQQFAVSVFPPLKAKRRRRRR